MGAWLYSPARRRIRGAYVIAPGLQPRGPDDPRLDRLARVLASASIATVVPGIPDFMQLRVVPEACQDFARLFDAVRHEPELADIDRPHVLAISFGVLPALRLASSARFADALGGVFVFGGYCDWRGVLESVLRGPRDSLDLPVLFINLLEFVPDPPRDDGPLRAAWLEFTRQTWGRPEMRDRARVLPLAEALAETLPPENRDLFLIGCGARAGAAQLCRAALDNHPPGGVDVDPRVDLDRVVCPVCLVHSATDDVIPPEQQGLLAGAFPSHVEVAVHLTGLFEHAGAAEIREAVRRLPQATRELATMARVVAALARPIG